MKTEIYSHEKLLSFFSSTVKLFLLKGNSYMNEETDEGKRYKEAKTPASRNGKRIEITQEDIETCLSENFWIGLEIPDGHILVDIDNKGIGETVADALKDNRMDNITLQTPNGFQFFFKDSGRVKTQTVKSITPAGIIVDYRLSGKGYTILPTANTADRHISWLPDAVTEMPDMFIPVRTAKRDEDDALDIPVMEGSRNSIMVSHAGRIRAWNSKYSLGLDERQVLEDINDLFCIPPLPQQELDNIFKSAQKLPEVEPIGNSCESETTLQEVCGLGYSPVMPSGFTVDEGSHLALVMKDRTMPICQSFGIVAKVKPEEGKEELGFVVKDHLGNEAVLSMNIADRKSFEKEITGFLERPLDSESIKLLQRYIAHYYRDNQQDFIVRVGFNRTGWKDGIFHIPTRTYENVAWLDDNLTNAYCCGGSRDQQISLLKEIIKTPASIVVLSALASTLVKPFNIPNVIVWVSGLKGKGKSTSVSYAESLFGNPRYLKGTWFSTRVGKEALLYMNTDMPVMIDELETLGSNMDEIINTVYQFESGFGKTRGRENLKNRKTKRLSGGLFITAEKDLDTLVASVSSKRTVPLGLYRRVLEVRADENFFTQQDTGGKFSLPAVNKHLLEHYGWFGIEWSTWLENNLEKVKELYGQNLQATSKIGEMEGAFASILTVVDILMAMGIANQDTLRVLKERVVRLAIEHRDKNLSVEDIAYKFKRKLADYCTMNGRSFVGLQYDYEKSNGFFGEVEDRDVFLLKTTFEKISAENGFVANQVLKQLSKNGDLETQRGHEKQKRISGKRYWGYSIKNVFEDDKGLDVQEIMTSVTQYKN